MNKTKYKKLPVGFKKKWLKALRSGEFKQAKQTLCDASKEEIKYCCLGVACKVAGYSNKYILAIDKYGFITKSTARKVPTILRGGEDGTVPVVLANMNDKGKKSFRFIADWIEKNL